MKIAIVDGYVDEPTCLGVPPFVSPTIRYLAGAIFSAGYTKINYYTIDQLRRQLLPDFDVIIVVAGTTVPGKYLGGTPATPSELRRLLEAVEATKILTGPAAIHGFSGGKSAPDDLFDVIVDGDAACGISEFLTTGSEGGYQPEIGL